jgi:YVTN family beta-propeller protein
MIRVILIPGIKGPHNLDLSLDEKTAYVRDIVKHVAIVNLATGITEKIINVGNGHAGIDVSPNGHYVVTGAIGDTYVAVIDTDSLKVHKIEVGNGPHGVRASKDSRWIYVAVSKDNVVAVINASTMKVEKKITVEKFPFWVAVDGNP